MAKIAPFRGVLYNQKKIKNLTHVITPPYDVISPQQQDEFYQSSPYNIIRVILNKEQIGDTLSTNKYTRARDFMHEWMKKGILQRDQNSGIYYIIQEFKLGKLIKKIRKGFVALLYLEEGVSDVVKGHEKTFAKPIEDRLFLQRCTQANFSQVFALYSDEQRKIDTGFIGTMGNRPALDFVDSAGMHIRMWKVTDVATVQDVMMKIADKKLLIADGHHRFQTALQYQAERKRDNLHHSGNEDYNFMMMYFSNIYDDNLVILPTHRIITDSPGINKNEFINKLSSYFKVDSFKGYAAFKEAYDQYKNSNAIGIYMGENSFYIVKIKSNAQNELIQVNLTLRALSTVILHDVIIKEILHIDISGKKHIEYIKEVKDVKQSVDKGNAQVGFILNPPPISQVMRVIESGNLMPEKSTYFYPKLLTGLVLNVYANNK